MKTKRKKQKEKPAGQWRVHNRVRDDCFHPAINYNQRSQYTSIFHTLSQRRLPAFSTLHSSHRSNRMPAFQPFASCRHFRADASIFHAAAAMPPSVLPFPPRTVFTCTHVSNGCCYCRWFGGFLRHGIMCTLYSSGRL